MDTPSTESNTPLDINGAAQAFSTLLDPPEVVEKSADDLEKEALAELTAEKPEEPQTETEEAEDSGVTIQVDGKTVTLTKAELAEVYKSGLRQSDYTKKTMEVSEQRKAAEAEIAKAHQERQQYATNLQKMAAQLEGALNEQNKIDWQNLLNNDPVEYLKQQHLFQQRQAAFQQNIQQQQQLAQIAQAESVKARESFLVQQQEQLLAKLPDWKDPAKASAEKAAVAKYLIEAGYDQDDVLGKVDANGQVVRPGVTDHKAILLARKAMLYDQMMSKANAAAKKVSAAPQRVVRSGVADSGKPDGRSAAMVRLGKTGKVEDAAAVFAQFL